MERCRTGNCKVSGSAAGIGRCSAFLRPHRDQHRWSELARVQSGTSPGKQAQIDYAQLWVWIGAERENVHLFVGQTVSVQEGGAH